MSNIELLPCPFCGSMEVNPIWHEDYCYHRMFYEMMLPKSEVIYSEEELRKAWNTRQFPLIGIDLAKE